METIAVRFAGWRFKPARAVYAPVPPPITTIFGFEGMRESLPVASTTAQLNELLENRMLLPWDVSVELRAARTLAITVPERITHTGDTERQKQRYAVMVAGELRRH